MLLENNGYPGDTRVRREALALVDAGFKVTVIAPKEGPQEPYEVVNGVSVYRYPAPHEHDSVIGFCVGVYILNSCSFFCIAQSVGARRFSGNSCTQSARYPLCGRCIF